MAAGKWNMQKASGGVASITVADGVTNTEVVLPESGTVATTSNIVGFKNYIINGNFDIWQYGVSQTTSGYGSDDRWHNANSGSTKTTSIVYTTSTERALFNATHFSRTVVTSVTGANNFCIKQQAIEDVNRLAGKTITISFWAKADGNKNIKVGLIQTFGTGGTPSAQVNNIGQQLIALTNTWQKKTITLTLPSIASKTLGTDNSTSATWLRFTFDSGTSYDGSIVGQQSGTFDIAQVQLEEGSVATPFENRPIGLEFSLCQRYYEEVDIYWQWDASLGGDAGVSVWSKFAQTKRVTPTVSVRSASNINMTQGGITSNSYGFKSVLELANPTTILSRSLSTIYVASAEL